VKPLLAQPHQVLEESAAKLQEWPTVISALESLLALNPDDPADLHFRQAAAFEHLGDFPKAKLHVLMSLEHAPRYRAALSKLRELASTPPQTTPADSDRPPRVPVPEPVPSAGF
jgi:tetratricopeptide (TPR) repeat protein